MDATVPNLGRRAFGAMMAALPAAALAQGADPLPSWRAGPRKRALLDFVAAVTREGGAAYVPPAERIAVFDNDGTLWVEQPAYPQLIFMMDRIRTLAPQNPAWQQDAVLRAAIAGDLYGAIAGGNEAMMRLAGAAMAGNSPEEFQRLAAEWLKTARHPKWDRPYTTLVYQPMLEVLRFLRASGFTNFIVSGGGVEFVRAFSQETYGIPPQHVVGSSFALTVTEDAGRLTLLREPRVDFIDDGPGKAIGIVRHIGRRPIAAFGNSDGDFEMLRYTTEAPGHRLGMIICHDDAVREFAYDRKSQIGRLSRALDVAPVRGWWVVSMREDWARVFP